MRLEVVVTDTSEAIIAQRAGASRVELVGDFEVGGLTPDERTIEAVTNAVSIPVHVILRSHDIGFVYSAADMREMLASVSRMRGLGVSAVVFGALNKRGSIAIDQVKDVATTAALPITFHRAFDSSKRLSAAYALLAGIPGVERVLTSGGALTAWEGRARLRELCYGNTAPTVVAAGGIDAGNVLDLVEFAGVEEVHVGRGARIDGKVDGRKIERLATLVLGGKTA